MDKFQAFLNVAEPIVVILSAIIAVFQLNALRKQTKTNHESTRRRTTVDVMTTWCNAIKKDTSLAERAARNLSEKQCKSLYNNCSFDVTPDSKVDICKFCSRSGGECSGCSLENDGLKVDGQILAELRWHVVAYLNALETVMTSWHMGTVDSKVIEEQFSFLLYDGKGHALSSFRNASGGYPYIEEFLDTIKNKPKVKHKRPL